MPSADKRQRKKENARAAREAREAAEKRQKRMKGIRNAVIAAAVVIAGIVLFSFILNKNDDDSASDTTTTTTPTESTTPGATVSPAAVEKVSCEKVTPEKPKKDTSQSEPKMSIDENKTYTATIETSCGNIKVELDAKNAPKGVNNFVTLAKSGFYDGLTFHRAVTDFVIQGGDPNGDGSGNPGYSTVTELPADGYPLGTLAWAKTGTAPAGSAGSQFFVVTSDHPSALEQKQDDKYQYGAFGKVTEGIEIAKKIEGFDDKSSENKVSQPVVIKKITISES
ncbi:MAG TPA: peptidylprolyl isomerase [Acidimicrobiia bacterium]|nr:peptidylprolyl isomerase [Acidimicrobiia bacterium]